MAAPVRRPVRVALKEGLHLRPLTRVSQVAGRFPCEVRLIRGDRVADAKAMLDLMGLGAGEGDELVVEAEGERADEAADAVARLFETNFAA